jgi:hypothetical protein
MQVVVTRVAITQFVLPHLALLLLEPPLEAGHVPLPGDESLEGVEEEEEEGETELHGEHLVGLPLLPVPRRLSLGLEVR